MPRPVYGGCNKSVSSMSAATSSRMRVHCSASCQGRLVRLSEVIVSLQKVGC
ncbi:hypothetical protein T02_7096 [Trichinella nativa]|uniref:Uncharacterized protein n=2 Tax=Trichinella TaxID=6333 RepID=A0A0V1KQN9_9BILA|nr:hypothetical protein T05_14317 [Trichinella murrelli]KRX52720.1 hypothetical protein T09_3382 [Trichinella sp. T9]KRZ49771.1 hypothetical protein T02_7096 [Trichinella nativa]